MAIYKRTKLCLLSGISLASIGTAAHAQEGPAALQPQSSAAAANSVASEAEDIIVTGSRIVRDGYKQPTPVTTLTSDQLKLAQPSSIADALNQLPQIQNSLSQNQTIAVNANTPAVANNINLRGVGSVRGLILLDGLRVPPTAFDGTTDVGVLPQMLISRVDIVTAGASAIYGSDAISGVVNYVLDKHFTGVKLEAQKGISTYGDAARTKFGIAVGTTALDGRLHVIASAEYSDAPGVDASDRKLFDQVWGVVGAGTTANPYKNTPNVRFATVTFGGKPSGALLGGQFVTGGAYVPYNKGTPVNNNLQIGGDGAYFSTKSLTASLKTPQFFGRAQFDLSPKVNLYVQSTFGEAISGFDCCENFSLTPFTIFADNAFLPANAKAILQAAGAASFPMTRMDEDIGRDHIHTDTRSLTSTVGAEAKVAGWNLAVHYTRGDSWFRSDESNQIMWPNFYAAMDAVKDPATGNIVCHVQLTNPGLYPGCVPINLFGNGSPSAAAKAYIVGDGIYKVHNSLDEFEATASGDLFKLWGRPVSLAVGASYRDQLLDETSNSDPAVPVDFTGLRGVGIKTKFQHTNVGSSHGKENVKEFFGELAVPVLADLPFAQRLEFDGAVRYADYSITGGGWTWKLGGRWEPTGGLTFRAARSRDFRAPTLFNLFAGTNFNLTNLPDKQSGITGTINTVLSGNLALKPEKGDTTTFGFVLEPHVLPGFALSIDAYKLKISDAIVSLSGPQIADLCFASGGTDPSCAAITRPSPNAFPTSIFVGPLNVGGILTQGIDIDASYRTKIGDTGFVFRALANYLDKYNVNTGTTTLAYAGAVDTSVSVTQGRNHWRAAVSANVSRGPVSVFVQERYLSPLRRNYNKAVIYADGDIPSFFYTDLTATVTVGSKNQFAIFTTVNNVFNKQPPIFPTQIFQQNLWYPTVQTTYDVIGRYFTIGVRAKF